MQTYVQVHVSQLLIASTPGKGRGSPGAARHDRGSSAHEAGAEWDVAWWLWNYIKHGCVVSKMMRLSCLKKFSLARVGKYSYLFENKYGIIIWIDACQRRSDAWVITVRNHLVETKLCHCHPLPLDWKKHAGSTLPRWEKNPVVWEAPRLQQAAEIHLSIDL